MFFLSFLYTTNFAVGYYFPFFSSFLNWTGFIYNFFDVVLPHCGSFFSMAFIT